MGGAAGPVTNAVTTDGQATAQTSDYQAQAQSPALEPYRPSVTTLQGFEGYQNPFRSAPGTSANSSPYTSLPGYESVRNPFYSPYQQQQPTTGPSASDLSAQYQAYTQGYAKDIQAAKDQRIADARAAEQAYQTARGNAALKAEYEAKLAEQQRQFDQQLQQEPDRYVPWAGGATGGIASLQKGFKR